MTTLTDIQSALSSCFPHQSLNLQVNHTGSQLSVMINRPANQEKINYEEIADTVFAKLRSLSLPNITAVKLYGRPANAKQVEWQTSRSLVAETPKPVVSRSNNGFSSGNSAVSQKPKSKFQEYLEQFSHYSNVISAASLVGLLALLGFNTLAGQKTQTVTYEYKIDSIPDVTFTDSMDRLGEEGWELVFARRAQDSTTDTFSYECIFKRVKK